MRILSAAFVERWRGRILNIHPSLLPDFAACARTSGRWPNARDEHGCTVHFVTADLDAGPIVAQARVPVLPGDDADALAARVLFEEHRIYPQALDAVARAVRTGRAVRSVSRSWRGERI